MSLYIILVGTALALSILAIVKPSWPFVAVGLMLVCIALLIRH